MKSSSFDTLIVGGKIVNGTGSPWFYGDVALSGDKIAAIAPPGLLPREDAARIVEAQGKVVCPGFIDIQSHSLVPLYNDGRAISKVTQGVTTEILGELWTPAPVGGKRDLSKTFADVAPELIQTAQTWKRFGDWITTYEERGVSVNIGSFVGGATIREWACGWDAGDPTEEEMEAMRRVTREAMDDGAFGIAPALIYPPSSFSPDYELIECAKIVGERGGVYIVHLRSEGDGFLDALEATIQLSRAANCPVEVYHLKASGARNWPKMEQAIARINQARAEGVDITADMYPYIASGTGLSVLIPLWASEGGRLWDNLTDADTRQKIYREMTGEGASTGDFAQEDRGDHVLPLGFKLPENKIYTGKTLTEIAEMRGTDWATAALDLLVSERQRIATVFFSMCEENVQKQLKEPWIKISTDAGGINPEGQTSPTHPRAYGSYPRVLGKYVREEKVLSLEEAVRKMSGAVADRLSLQNRGYLREGAFADVVVFDPETVIDKATFTDPHQLSVGIEHVFVNGEAVINDGVHTNALPGRTVYGAGKIYP